MIVIDLQAKCLLLVSVVKVDKEVRSSLTISGIVHGLNDLLNAEREDLTFWESQANESTIAR